MKYEQKKFFKYIGKNRKELPKNTIVVPFNPETEYNFPEIGWSHGFTGIYIVSTNQTITCGTYWFEKNFVEISDCNLNMPEFPVIHPVYKNKNEYEFSIYLRSIGYTAKEIENSLGIRRNTFEKYGHY